MPSKPEPKTETIKVAGLARMAGWIFAAWGAAAAATGLYDLVWGEPEANLFSPEPWTFVTRPQWLRYASFELVYGLACLGVGLLLFSYAKRLPETLRRERRPEEVSLF